LTETFAIFSKAVAFGVFHFSISVQPSIWIFSVCPPRFGLFEGLVSF